MSNNDNILDDIIRQQVNDGVFQMKEAHWEKMSAMIDDDRPSTKPRFPRWMLNGLLLLVALGSAIYIGVSAANSKAHANKIAQDTVGKAAQKLGSLTQAVEQELLETKLINAQVAQRKSDAIKPLKDKTSSKPQTYNSTKNIISRTSEKLNARLITNNKTTKATSPEINKMADEVVKLSQDAIAEVDYVKATEAANVSVNQSTEVVSERKQLSVESTNPRYKPNATFEKQIEKENPAKVVAIQESQKEENTKELPATKTVEKQDRNYYGQYIPSTTIYVAAGVNGNAGLTGNLSVQTQQLGVFPYAQLGVQKELTEKISIDGALGYSSNNALNTSEKFLTNNYSFGRDTNSFHIQYQTYNYMYLPLGIRYKLTDALAVNAGANASYMLDVRSKLWDKVYGTRTSGGYGVGFNRLDIGAQLGFSFAATRALSIDINAQQGLTDITNNTYFKNTINDKQRRASIGLRYKLGKRRN
jgi:hypothetical protein